GFRFLCGHLRHVNHQVLWGHQCSDVSNWRRVLQRRTVYKWHAVPSEFLRIFLARANGNVPTRQLRMICTVTLRDVLLKHLAVDVCLVRKNFITVEKLEHITDRDVLEQQASVGQCGSLREPLCRPN